MCERGNRRKSIGCARPSTGVANRFVKGAMSDTRPKVHATRGAVTRLAMTDAARFEAIQRRQPSRCGSIIRRENAPLAMSPAIPATLSWYPRSSTVRGSTSGSSAPTASAAHGDVGRCSNLDADVRASMAPERTAGAGAPMIAI
jgi:hypothetical protein